MLYPVELGLPEELSEETKRLMRLLGHVSRQGRLREDGRDKLEQVISFLPLMRKVLSKTNKRKSLNVLECASGKGHLGLLLNQFLSEETDREINWVGIDNSEKLVKKCRNIAEEMGLENVEYRTSRILDYTCDGPIHVLLGLHACDTATDEALVKGLEIRARYIFLVPCCQREVSGQLAGIENGVLAVIAGNYTHRKVLGTLLTDSLRRLILESFGYEVDVFEYVSVRRTEKNIMIRGESGKVPDENSWVAYRSTLEELGLRLTLDELLVERGLSPPLE